jgi:hypothetical protein
MEACLWIERQREIERRSDGQIVPSKDGRVRGFEPNLLQADEEKGRKRKEREKE